MSAAVQLHIVDGQVSPQPATVVEAFDHLTWCSYRANRPRCSPELMAKFYPHADRLEVRYLREVAPKFHRDDGPEAAFFAALEAP